MKLKTSNKTSTYGKKPHIKKGYYPAQLLKVEPFTDAEGKMKEGKYGKSLIFEFAVYKADPETNAPIEPITFEDKQEGVATLKSNVVIPKFVYHEYKNKKTGEFQTAITPNSAITRILKALGWEFSEEDVEIDNLIGNWVEVNVDDYEQTTNDGTYTASTIKDINPYKGPAVKDISALKKEPKEKSEGWKIQPEKGKNDKEITVIKAKIKSLKNLNKDGLLSDEGLKQGMEQLESKIEELKK